MLTKDILGKVDGLTEEQVSQITQLSENDEKVQIELATDKAIKDRTRKIYDDLDADFKDATGMDKPEGKKSYEWYKDVLVRVGQNADLLKEIDRLKKQGSAQSDDKLLKQIEDKDNLVDELRKQLEADKSEYEKKIGEGVNELKNLRVIHEFDKALSGLKFDESYNDEVVKTFIKSAQSDVLKSVNPEFVDDKLVFRDADGKTLLNADNNLNPYTAGELLADKLKPILAKEKSVGTGTKGAVPQKGDKVALDYTGVKTKAQGTDMIYEYMLAEGITRGSDKWFAKLGELTEDERYKNLPINAK